MWTNYLISELMRAANEVEKLSDFDVRQLLGRAVSTICDMREEIGLVGLGTAKDAVVSFQTAIVAIGPTQRTEAQIKAALLDAAGLIRDLHLVLGSRTKVVGARI